jgi:hypothetical protein
MITYFAIKGVSNPFSYEAPKYPSGYTETKALESLKKVERSTLEIQCSSAAGLSNGTGFVFRQFSNGDAYILTAAHVLEDKERCEARLIGKGYELHTQHKNGFADIAIAFTNIPDNESGALEFLFEPDEGENIVTMGYRESNMYLSFGNLAKKEETRILGQESEKYKVNAFIRQGNSGGPVTDDLGRIIGVNITRESDYTRVGGVSAAKNLQKEIEKILGQEDRKPSPDKPKEIAKKQEPDFLITLPMRIIIHPSDAYECHAKDDDNNNNDDDNKK